MIDQEEALALRDRLNQLSDQLNQRIEQWEVKFKAYGFGLATHINTSDGLAIGYMRWNKHWRLVIKERSSEDIMLLADSPRAYRLHALKHIDKLEEAMVIQAKRFIERLEKYLMGKPDDETDTND